MGKLKIFGLDGVDYFTIRKNRNKLKSWAKLLERFPLTLMWTDIEDVKRPWKFDSAMLWTSLFTGKRPEEHGIWGFKVGIEGRRTTREDVKAQFIWENGKTKFLVWHVPAQVPPLSWRCKDVEMNKVVHDLGEWCGGVERLLNSEIEFDVFISVFSGSDEFQHHHWDDEPALLKFYDEIAKCLLTHIRADDDVLIISDHGFTDIDTSLAHMWTWRYSKIKNYDVGHHAPWGICATNLRWRPFKVSEVHEAIIRHLTRKNLGR